MESNELKKETCSEIKSKSGVSNGNFGLNADDGKAASRYAETLKDYYYQLQNEEWESGKSFELSKPMEKLLGQHRLQVRSAPADNLSSEINVN